MSEQIPLAEPVAPKAEQVATFKQDGLTFSDFRPQAVGKQNTAGQAGSGTRQHLLANRQDAALLAWLESRVADGRRLPEGSWQSAHEKLADDRAWNAGADAIDDALVLLGSE